MRNTIIGLFLSLLLAGGLRAEQPIFTIADQEVSMGQIIDVNVMVDDFTNLISVQYSVNWDPTVLQYRTLKNFNSGVPGLTAAVFGASPPLVENGQLTLTWFESSITPITIPDGSLFFTIEFEVIGDPCDQSPVAITDTPTEIEVSEPNDVEVGLVANNGTMSIPGVGCAQGIEMIGNQINGPCGGQACIQFTVENFNDVGTMEFSLDYNPAVLSFVEFRNFAPLLSFGEGNTNLVSPGLLRVLWFNLNVENESLPDGTVLFEICFNVIGGGGQSSEITFGTNPSPSFTDIDDNPYDVTITPASITAQCQLEGFALIADTVCTQPGETVCMPIRANDFEDIVAMQFSVNWDPTLFEFDRVESFGIPGLDPDGFGTPGIPGVAEGQLTVSWFDLSLNGVTIPDFDTLFVLCLTPIGNAGTASAVTFTDTPLEIEVATLDSVLEYSLVQGLAQIRLNCEGCEFSYTVVTTPPSCPRDEDGVVNLTVLENCPETPTYLWDFGGATTEDLTGVPAGIYTVTITLGSSVVIATATVTDPPGIDVNGVVTDPDPIGASNGSINITVTGGSPPYMYMWSNQADTEDLSNIGVGEYFVTITDSNGCTFIPDAFIVGAEVAAAVTNVTCPGGNNGAINLSVSFGTGPYTYMWSNQATTEDIGSLTAGSYCVTVTDTGGATRDTCFTVSEPAAVVLTASITGDPDGNCVGAIDLNVTGGIMPFTYLWSHNAATSQDLTGLCTGQYCVTVTYGQGCTATQCFTVGTGNLGVSLVATNYGGFGVSCEGVCDGEIMTIVDGAVEPVTYRWSNNATTADLADLCAGTFTVTVTDGTGNTATNTVVLSAPPAITVDITSTLPSDFGTSDGAIFVVVNGGRPPYQYAWTGPQTGSTAALNNIPAGTYTLQVTDASGCTDVSIVQLLPGNAPCYQGISIFTPNSDGHNDFFIITCVLDAPNRLYIFNRSGGLVYETQNYQNNWIGVDGDGQPQPDGGYFWVLEVTRPDGSVQIYRGTVNLLRTAD